MGKPYRECPHCGAHLDAGEKCDCQTVRQDIISAHKHALNKPQNREEVSVCASACMMQNRNI